MRRVRVVSVVMLLLAFAGAALTACGPRFAEGAKGGGSGRGTVGDLEFTLAVRRPEGKPWEAVLQVKNTGGKAVRLTYPSSQRYDFVVKQGDRTVWRWSADKAFLMVITEDELAAGEARTYREELPAVPAGAYTVEAYHIATSKTAPAATAAWSPR